MAGQGWLVSEAVVDASLEDLRGAAAGGIAGLMESARKRRHSAVYIADIGGIPDGRKYRFRHACPSAHPGVRVSQDASIYHAVMDVSRALEAFLGMDGVGKLFAFMGSQDRPPPARPPPHAAAAPIVVLPWALRKHMQRDMTSSGRFRANRGSCLGARTQEQRQSGSCSSTHSILRDPCSPESNQHMFLPIICV
jgi:hypothetical protein